MEQQSQSQIVKDELAESCQADEPTIESSTVSRPSRNKYAEQVESMVNNETTTMYVDFNDVSEFDDGLATTIQLEYKTNPLIFDRFYRLHNYLRQAVRQFVQSIAPEYVQSSQQQEEPKDFFISFYNCRGIRKLRELDANKIGQLLAFSGTVTRTSEVKPELLFGTFKCGSCDQVIFNVEQQFKYTQPTICPNPVCSNTTDWELLPNSSKFVDWQKVRVQENSTEIPPGSMPRSIDVILRHEIVDKVKAGNGCIFTGTLIVIPDISQLYRPGEVPVGAIRNNNRTEGGEGVSGLKALGVRDLSYKLAFLANGIQSVSDKFAGNNFTMDDTENTFTEEERTAILRIRNEPNLYQKIVRSLAPNIFGHSDIKRGILLMLCGGVHKKSSSGQQLRGDLNICIVGDPATAKSQFLKYVCNFMPRAVYTSGKSSSAAGLTASVVMDQDTGELGIEAGALMLADNGICCIDEFDKMNIVDQVAIHEAMEQQTISISKAGIQATLNARASILAAANPVYGRYDKSKTLRQNINMTAPIMSRFDLFFVIADENNETTDARVAEHILKMHQEYEQVDSGTVTNADFTMEELQKYISFARTFNPIITPEAKAKLCENYKKLRRNDNTPNSQQSYRITIRQLESLVRLSEALARVHLDDQVKPVYVDEAYRLLQQSVIRVESKDIVLGYDENDDDEDNNNNNNSNRMEEESSGESKRGGGGMMMNLQEYVRISESLCFHIQDIENETVVWKDLVRWYVEQQRGAIGEIESDEIKREIKKVNLIVKRLVHQDKLLIFADNHYDYQDEDRTLIVNPNHVPPQE